MRRNLALLVGIAAVVAVMLGASLLIPEAGKVVRHADAKAAQPELPSLVALVLGYSSVFSAVASGDYSNASELVLLLNSSYVPDSIRYIFSRFNSLLSSAVSDMNQTEALLEVAEKALGVGSVEEAKALAWNASVSLWRANSTALLVKDSSSTLASQLKVPQIRNGTSALDARVNVLAQELSSLKSEIAKVEEGEVLQTEITMELDRREAWVGSPVAASGHLTAEGGNPVAGATVHVQVVGGASYQAVTGADGGYSVTFTAPFSYVEGVVVYAYYSPGTEAELAGSRSPDSELRLLWVKPDLHISLNATRAKPGDWILVSGSTGLGGAYGEVVKVSAFGSTSAVPAVNGVFEVALQVPAGAPGGPNTVRAEAAPSGVLGPGSAAAAVEVYRLATVLVLDVPSVALSGTSVTVSGRVSPSSGGSPIPVRGAEVSVELGDSLYLGSCETGEDGGFELSVPIGLGVPTGRVEIRATARPGSGIYLPSSASSGLYAVNPSLFAVPAVGMALAYGSARRGLGRGRGGAGRVAPAAGAQGSEGAVSSVAAAAAAETPASGGTVRAMHAVSAHRRAAAAIGSLLGRGLGRSETLREFLSRASGRIGEASGPFAELTGMAEEELYAGRAHDRAKSESLLERVLSFLSALRARIAGAAAGGKTTAEEVPMEGRKGSGP